MSSFCDDSNLEDIQSLPLSPSSLLQYLHIKAPCTDKKENQIFLIYREIQNGAVAKSYMTNGLPIYGEIFAHFLIYQEALPHL
jgi:hypothetical protein